ncbi:MAG: aldo/keto reductase [Gemmatimonadota bacterium]|nr:aldo/keto reductase [Gemmatimonadota bacterium]
MDTHLDLNPEVGLPRIGFGTYQVSDDDVYSVVLEALRIGYRHVDTAEGYENECGVGRAIESGMRELGLSRGDVFVTTKLMPGFPDHGMPFRNRQTTVEACIGSLSRLNLEYVDLYLIHAPLAKEQRIEQWQALVELKEMGKLRSIGVSNYGVAHIEEIASAGLPLPDANQIEIHPWSQKPKLVSYLLEKEISIIAYSSLAPLSNWREDGHSIKTEKMKEAGLQQDSPFKRMARKYNVTEAQILLRWGLQRGYAILPKSTHVERIRENFELMSFQIDEDDMAMISVMDQGDGVAWYWDLGDPTKLP